MAYQVTYRDVKRTLKSHSYNQSLLHESLESRKNKVKNLEFSRTLYFICLIPFSFGFFSFLCELCFGEKTLWGKKRVLSTKRKKNWSTASRLSECVGFLVSKETVVFGCFVTSSSHC